jgi:hypothetical protein
MNYNDIPQRIKSYYKVDSDWEYFQDWLTKHGVILNPDFQRGVVWDENKQIKYIEYVLSGGESGRDIYFNHPGWMSSFEGEMVCVDGLQRITAVQRFLNNEIPAYNTFHKDFEGRTNNKQFVIFVGKLQTKKDVLKWYLEMNEGRTAHTEEDLNKVRNMLNSI